MRSHTYNGCVVFNGFEEIKAKVFSALKPGEQIGSNLIGHRVGLSQDQTSVYLRHLRDSGKVQLIRRGIYTVYARCAVKPRKRQASSGFAGPVRIGRGLANW